MNLSGSDSLFNLQASLTLDTSAYESAISSVTSSADIDDITVNVTANVTGDDQVDELSENISALDGTTATADADADVSGQDEVDTLSETVSEVGELDETAEVGADVSGQSDVEALGQSIADLGSGGASGTASDGIQALTDKITTVLAGAGTFAAISGIYNAIKDLVSETASLGDSIDKGADRMGMTNTQYQVWDQIMQHCGSDISALKRGMNNLVDPTDEVSEALATLGLNTEEFSSLGRADQFEQVISALQAMGQTDPSGMEALAKSILGANWQQFATLLQQTPEEMESMKETAEALAMDDSMVDASASYTDALQDLNNALTSLKTTLLEDTGLLPTLTGFMNSITGIIVEMQKDGLEETITKIGTAFTQTVQDINSQELNANAIVEAMEALGDPTLFTEEQSAKWDAYYEKLCEVVPGIEDEFGKELNATSGATDALKDHIKYLMDDAKAQAAAKALANKQEVLAEAYEKQVDAQLDLAVAQQAYNDALNDPAYQSYLEKANKQQSLGAGTALLTGGFSVSSGASTITAEEQEAARLFAEANNNLTEAQTTYDSLTSDLTSTQSYIEAWEDALWDFIGLDPSVLEETVANIEDSSKAAVDSVTDAVDTCKEELNSLEGQYDVDVTYTSSGNFIPGGSSGKTGSTGNPDHNKNGLDYVPFDNYATFLHEGERVLTKSENAEYSSGYNVAALAAAIAERPISFSVGDTALATSLATASGRANAQRAAAISSGYGRGMQ